MDYGSLSIHLIVDSERKQLKRDDDEMTNDHDLPFPLDLLDLLYLLKMKMDDDDDCPSLVDGMRRRECGGGDRCNYFL